MANYFALLTNQGAAKLANAASLGIPLKLTAMAVGDGNGQAVTPNPAATKLVNEKRRAQLNALFADPLNASQLVAEQIIPETVGGWWIRELGLYDEAGTLIAVANCPDTYKPLLSEGSGRTQVIRMVLIVSSTSAVELKIDPAVVLATRQYVDEVLKTHKESRDHPDASEAEKGFSRLATQAEVNETVAANRKADVVVTVKTLWGWVKQATETVLGMVKFAGKDDAVAGTSQTLAMNPLRVMDSIKNILVGIPLPWPMATPPSWGMAYQGQAFSGVENPILAQRYPSLVLPDLRAEFLRGLDAGRGKDPGRTILSAQSASLITGETVDRVVSISRMQNVKNYFFDPLQDTTTQIAMSSIQGTNNTMNTPASQYIGGARPTSVAFLWITIKG